jgi:hypothetical protein
MQIVHLPSLMTGFAILMDNRRLQTLLAKSLLHVCIKELNWVQQIRLQGLVCVTIDEADVLVSQIDERLLEGLHTAREHASPSVDENVHVTMPNICLTRLSTGQLKNSRVADSLTLSTDTESSVSEQPDGSLAEPGNTRYVVESEMNVAVLGTSSAGRQINNVCGTCLTWPVPNSPPDDCCESQRAGVKAEPVEEMFDTSSLYQEDTVIIPPVDFQKTELVDVNDSKAQRCYDFPVLNGTQASSSDNPNYDVLPCYNQVYKPHHHHSIGMVRFSVSQN